MQDYERLGVLYLGRVRPLGGATSSQPFLVESRDLVTHGVIVGMTGSGKTGLGIDLLEEAAIDSVPCLVVDPKGDLGNLLLTFPDMQAEDFLPWVDTQEAQREQISPQQLAENQARKWREGLASWDQTAERIQLLRKASDVVVYTPGSTAGVPISLLSSFEVPSEQVIADPECFGDLVQSTVSGLLGLVGGDTDPLSSREHLLLSAILQRSWQAGQKLSLAEVIAQVQNPPFQQLGVLDLESFYPGKERFKLVMSLNGLLASPGFQCWMQGVPLDISKLLYSSSGKPQIAVVSIAHLSDSERMYFVTMLCEAMVTWMRSQTGTSSLRALFYMDEVFGYLPAVANPPSKRPLLTLLKQARAFGLGLVLSTQNPGDLDYKALANCGSWFIGRLQTERDRSKVSDGLMQALGTNADANLLEQALSGLDKRVFLALTPGSKPTLFETRWTLSYLRGPMSREDLKRAQPASVVADLGQASGHITPEAGRVAGTASFDQFAGAVPSAAVASSGLAGGNGSCPSDNKDIESNQKTCASNSEAGWRMLSAEIPQSWVPPNSRAVSYWPVLLGVGTVHVEEKKLDVAADRDVVVAVPVTSGPIMVDWDNAKTVDCQVERLQDQPQPGLAVLEVAPGLRDIKNYKLWSKDFGNWLYCNQRLELLYCPAYKMLSKVGETESNFRARVSLAAREARDAAVDELKEKYLAKQSRLQDKLARALDQVERERADVSQASSKQALSFGSSLLGAICGRKLFSAGNLSRVTSAVRSSGNVAEQKRQCAKAESNLEAVQAEVEQLERQLQTEASQLQMEHNIQGLNFETKSLGPRKTDISVRFFGVGFVPLDSCGAPAW